MSYSTKATYSSRFGQRSTRCIPLENRCNGNIDCGDRSDEKDCPKRAGECGDRFYCPESHQCGVRCDGEIDCQLGEDERDCHVSFVDPRSCSAQELLEGAIECLNLKKQKTCVPREWQCDGETDCVLHGEDESLDLCGTEHLFEHPCRTGVFCNGHCMTLHVCDGQSDCPNGEDEKYCGEYCLENQFACSNLDPQTRRPVCLDFEQICDGTRDCLNGDDEDKELCEHHKCTDNNLHCYDSDGTYTGCVSTENNATLICDGKWDCREGSDERACDQKQRNNRPVLWYDRAGKVDCYKKEGSKFVPNIHAENLSNKDAIPCIEDFGTCVELSTATYHRGMQKSEVLCSTLFQVSDLGNVFAIDPCETSANRCEQQCLAKTPKESVRARGYITEGADVSSLDGAMSSYTCDCFDGYVKSKHAAQGCDSADQAVDLIMLDDERGQLSVVMGMKYRPSSGELIMHLENAQRVENPSQTKTINRIVTDIRRQRLIYLTNEQPKSIFVSKPARPGSEKLRTPQARHDWVKAAVQEMYTSASEITFDQKVTDIFYIMELDMLLVVADNPYLLSLRNGKYVRAVRIAERMHNFAIKSVAYFQHSCAGTPFSVLLVSDGQLIRPIEMSDNVFRRDVRASESLFGALNVDLGVGIGPNITSLAVDPFKCIVYYSDTNLNIWSVRLNSAKLQGHHRRRYLVASLYHAKYQAYHFGSSDTIIKTYYDEPVIEMTIFENHIFVVIKDKRHPSRHSLAAVSTLTGEVKPLLRGAGDNGSDARQITVAPWMGTDARMRGQIKTRRLDCSSCGDDICLVDSMTSHTARCFTVEDGKAPDILVEPRSVKLSCDGTETEWDASLCYEENDLPMFSAQTVKAYNWTMIVLALLVIVAGLGMFYMYRLRENRYSRIPPSATTTLTRTAGGGDYGETDLTWDATVPSSEFRNELFDEIHNTNQPGGQPSPNQLPDVVKQGEKENLLENDELNMQR